MQLEDNAFVPHWNDDTSYQPKTATYPTNETGFCPKAVSDYVDNSTCGGCEESHPSYGKTWSTALLGPNERAAEIYDLCRKIDDRGDGYMEAVRELKGKLNDSEEWEKGVRDFLVCVEDDNFEADIHYDDDEYLDRAYRYGAFKGVSGASCCDPNENRLAEMAACLVHSGMKCVRAGEKRRTEHYVNDQDMSSAMVTVGIGIMFSLTDSMADRRCCDEFNRRLHQIVGAHHMMAYAGDIYNPADQCHKQWTCKVNMVTCVRVVDSVRVWARKKGMQSVDSVLLRLHDAYAIWKPARGRKTKRVYNINVNDISTPRLCKRYREIEEAYSHGMQVDDHKLRDEIFGRICQWGSCFTAVWRAGYAAEDRIREMSFVGAVLGVHRDEYAKVSNEKADQALYVCTKMARLTDSAEHRLLAQAATRAVAIRSRNGGPCFGPTEHDYMIMRSIDGVWELTQLAATVTPGCVDTAICMPVLKAGIEWFNTVTHVNREDEIGLAENRFTEFKACQRCVCRRMMNLLNTHHISIGIFMCLLWGTLLYADNGIAYDAYIDGQIAPQSMRQNLSTKCGRCGIVPGPKNKHGVVCLTLNNEETLI
ncbi:hypothetical protein CONCODRAFT_13423 [Conidiobolus coronatus NRRL 28638]|uniref:Uncharacterized protein n=1 Tax=Conidiobolus coronatus (strain ATCC 28846 / CBS 209.66 / NRRL 28638) TaxID=796925 RepID=A0A137NQR0_CONC2|nr:hypothetical protein CONCODRAFT_13423 [Conidiobolus coronatus NRRL 28638]|eukprot:KXN65105.1 hypothetical protein CONCODRAFT_13423 [Conidiobolus coronatus NRRL 28638]